MTENSELKGWHTASAPFLNKATLMDAASIPTIPPTDLMDLVTWSCNRIYQVGDPNIYFTHEGRIVAAQHPDGTIEHFLDDADRPEQPTMKPKPVASIPMPVAEVADRYTITCIRLYYGVGNKEEMLKRRDHYAAGLDLENPALLALVEELMIFNRTIWAAEDDIREGRDKEVGLEEIGRRALKVKGLNAQRVLVKDKISKLTLTGFQEAKVNYAS